MIENDLALALSLDGEWDFSLAGAPAVRMPVPAAWEAHIADKITDGPALYRRGFEVTAAMLASGRMLLEFGAASFWALVRVNQVRVAVHQGLWSPFQVEVTRWLHAGQNDLEVEIWKPGRRFPVRETVAGFLPDVATAFGGLWQGVRLLSLETGIEDLRVLSKAGGRVEVSGVVVGLQAGTANEVEVRVDAEPEGTGVPWAVDAISGRFHAELDLSKLTRWRAEAPALHTLTVSVWHDGQCRAQVVRTVGLRDVSVSEGALWLDGRPLHLRGVLDWGWHADQIRPAPAREAVKRQIEQSRALGFNLIKLCLFVPDEATFEAADEAGQFVWLEMPLWLPRVTPELRAVARQEYEAVFRRLHHHPCIVAVSLGCELDAGADAEFLGELHALARGWFPNALVCDNSGSAEAYGGVSTSLQDFYDYHFYTDPHFFRPLIDHFDRAYRPRKPWLFGEFCDADTLRDFNLLSPAPWWLTEPLALDRDDFLYTRDYLARLAAAGVTDGGAGLTQIARKQATAVRKYVLEQTRLHSATGGYVVSGWADTPITTSGIVDDQGELKFAGDEWQRFNGDGVLLIERPRRRSWTAGGDRPAYADPFSWWIGELMDVRVLLSNALGPIVSGRLFWRLTDANGTELGSGGLPVGALPAAQIGQVGELRLPAPAAGTQPLEMSLQADLTVVLAGGLRKTARNRWTLWAIPRPALSQAVGILDRDAVLARHDLTQLAPQTTFVEASAATRPAPLLALELTPELLDLVQGGRKALLWGTQADPRFTRRLPFWREAIHVFEPHELWSRLPQPGYADMRFFSLAGDVAIDRSGLQASLGAAATCRPLWRRFDARALTWAEYLIEVTYGQGQLFISSLRFDGGLGHQPQGLAASPWGAWWLASLLKACQGDA